MPRDRRTVEGICIGLLSSPTKRGRVNNINYLPTSNAGIQALYPSPVDAHESFDLRFIIPRYHNAQFHISFTYWFLQFIHYHLPFHDGCSYSCKHPCFMQNCHARATPVWMVQLVLLAEMVAVSFAFARKTLRALSVMFLVSITLQV